MFVLAGWTLDHEWDRACDENLSSSSYNDPNSLRVCDWSGSLEQGLGAISGVPYRK